MIESWVKTSEGRERVIALNVQEYIPHFVKFGTHRRGEKFIKWAEEFACLDTETSHDCLERSWIYQWSVFFNGDFIQGRTPSEFMILLNNLKDHYKLNDDRKIIFYIHNGSYDLQYLKNYLFEYDPNISVLATDAHSILILDVYGFRFLCSYKLSNMNLELFSRTYAEKYRKAVGEINYNIVRYQDEPLDPDVDWYYMLSDVRSQHDAICGYLKTMGYQYAYQAPFTSTGFVRAECRKAAAADKKWRKRFTISALNEQQYALCRQAFTGGLTIQNYLYTGDIMEGVGHVDFTSSYPARQMMDYFPTHKPTWYGRVDDLEELELLLNKYCCVFIFSVTDIHLRHGVTAPYIPSSKCIWLKGETKLNGKIVKADSLSMAVTEIDFHWIRKQYDFENLSISNMMIMDRGPAPEWLRKEVMRYFRQKCELKNGDQRLYAASKAKLNAIYGMSATSIIRQEYELDEMCQIEEKELTEEEKRNQLEKYYRSRNSFMSYQLGVYTTAHARNALMEMIETVGYDNFIYCDTDSVFYIRNPDTDRRLEEMNARIRERATAAGAFIGNKYLGEATPEAPIKRFKGLHAKCYACEELGNDGEYQLNVTIAGIPKKATKWVDGQPVTVSNSEELGSLENLQDGFTFKHCGGTRAVYVERDPVIEEINGHKTEYASSVIIDSIEKEISDTMFTYGKDYEILHIRQERTI